MIISLIVAADENNGIGKDNQLPWHLPADLKHFKNLTSGHTIIMGRKTYDSIGKALPNRRNMVISRTPGLRIPDAEVFSSLEQALGACRQDQQSKPESDAQEIFIIGGAEIFKQAFPLADILYLTRIHADFEADTFLETINEGVWLKTETESHEVDEKNKYPYTFIKYRKA